MDIKDIKRAIVYHTPVVYEGNEYLRILNCVLWYDELQHQFRYSLKLQDKKANSVIKAPIEKVELLK